MLKGDRRMNNFFGSTSVVDINSFSVYRPDEIYKSDLEFSKDHHLYMVLEVDKIFVEKYTVIDNILNLTIANSNKETQELCLEFDRTDFIINETTNKQYLEVDGFKLFVTQLLIDLGYTVKTRLLYIGKAIGGENCRSSIERLKSHETLQRILAESPNNRPNSDILLLTFGVDETKYLDTFVPIDEAGNSIEDHSDFVAEKQLISMVEAKLINYFKPEYNIEFSKGEVPRSSHSSYNEYYGKRFNSMYLFMNVLPNFIFKTDTRTFNVKEDNINYNIEGSKMVLDYFK